MLLMSIYIFLRYLIPEKYKQISDLFYLYVCVLLPLSWMIYNNECVISLVYKLQHDSQYIPGSKITWLPDINAVIGNHRYMYLAFNTCLFLNIFAIFFVNHLSLVPALAYAVFFILYSILLRTISTLSLTFLLFKGLYLVFLILFTSFISFFLYPNACRSKLFQ